MPRQCFTARAVSVSGAASCGRPVSNTPPSTSPLHHNGADTQQHRFPFVKGRNAAGSGFRRGVRAAHGQQPGGGIADLPPQQLPFARAGGGHNAFPCHTPAQGGPGFWPAPRHTPRPVRPAPPAGNIFEHHLPIGSGKISSASLWRMRWARLISLGMTTRPSSSILRTIPVVGQILLPLHILYNIPIIWKVRRFMYGSAFVFLSVARSSPDSRASC